MAISIFDAETNTTRGVSRLLNMSGPKFLDSHVSAYCLRTHPWHVVWALVIGIIVLLLLNYMRDLYRFHYQNRFELHGGNELTQPSKLPPLYPSLIPFLGSAISFAWDNAAFIRRAAIYQGQSTAARVAILPGLQIFLFQDRDTIRRLFKHPAVGSPIPVYTFAIKNFFGMPESAVRVYRADNSGSGSKPQPGSQVAPDARAFHATHKGLLQGLTGTGLGPNTHRYVEALVRNLQVYQCGQPSATLSRSSPEDWLSAPDMFHFVQHTVGSAMIEAHFGPTLLRLSPTYMDDLWKLDAGIPWFSRQVPRLFIPEIYRARDRMVQSLMGWYKFARLNFDESQIHEDGDGDPIWGSSLSRYRQETLPSIKEHDDRAMASLDVGHSWGSTSNVVATTFMAIYEVFSDPELLQRLRMSLTATLGTPRLGRAGKPLSAELDTKKLNEDALLCSVYAETLRRHGMTHFLVSAPADLDVELGRWLLPRGSVGVLNSGISHMDSTFWNTRNGQYPLTKFWADRFLVDPHDPDSGPVNPAHRQGPYSRPSDRQQGEMGEDRPYFSMEGTEGSWFPYGGGGGICLGRFLAKNSIMSTLAYIILELEIEPLVDRMVVNDWRYGLGVNQPRYATPFRVKKRED